MTAPPNCITHQLTLIPIALDDTSGSHEANRAGNETRQKDTSKTIIPQPQYFEFRNTHLLWRAPNARNIFGGVPLAHVVGAAQHTVPAHFIVHSSQGFFIRAGDPALHLRYVVRAIRDSRGSASRVVEVFQQQGALRQLRDDEVIFTAMLSFVASQKNGSRNGSKGRRVATHPRHTTPPFQTILSSVSPNVPLAPSLEEIRTNSVGKTSEAVEVVLAASQTNTAPPTPIHLRRVCYWMRCRTRLPAPAGASLHAETLSYMSDRVFFGVVQRVHHIRRYTIGENGMGGTSMFRDELGMLRTMYTVKESEAEEALVRAQKERAKDGKAEEDGPTIDFLASMSQTMYFHDLDRFRADEWVLTELESPWADNERGMAVQRMYGSDGRLVASCTQEGVIRLSRPRPKI